MTEIMELLNVLGGWEIMVRAGAIVAMSSMILALFKNPNAFIKRAVGFVSAAIVALILVGYGPDLGKEVIKNWFASTVLWSILLKPMLTKLIESWKPSGL